MTGHTSWAAIKRRGGWRRRVRVWLLKQKYRALAWLADFKAAYAYVRDPHGWEARYRVAIHQKFKPRPSMVRVGNEFICHPAVLAGIDREIKKLNEREPWTGSPLHFLGSRVRVSPLIVDLPPTDGWPDIEIPERPRFAP